MWYSELVTIPDLEGCMSWSWTTREKYRRVAGGFESDVTDEEWALIDPLVPKRSRLGRPRETDARGVFNAIQYVLATGCQWRALPTGFPRHSTVMNYSVVERTFAWMGRCCRLTKDIERILASSLVVGAAGVVSLPREAT